MLNKFWKEAMLWGQLSHPNVLTIYGLYLSQNRLSIVAPWMENEDIRTYLEKFPSAPRVGLAADTANGLLYLHNNDIIHGDMKSANILVDEAGRARVADFGISSVLDAEIVEWTTQMNNFSEGGTSRWQAPELHDVENGISAKSSKESDVYSLGCVFFEIFTGKIPFSNLRYNEMVILRVRSGVRPVRPEASSQSWTAFGLTNGIWTCMEECWEEEPSKRPPTAAIVRRLTGTLTDDGTCSTQESSKVSPVDFRRQMSKSFTMINIEDLQSILNKSQGIFPARDGGSSGMTECKEDAFKYTQQIYTKHLTTEERAHLRMPTRLVDLFK
ncbi:hypothetical protein DXG01_008337 [Tephrocybe rancida]|nr:hypothetical protein DXG01_008337 [Tephrocybe rancida]